MVDDLELASVGLCLAILLCAIERLYPGSRLRPAFLRAALGAMLLASVAIALRGLRLNVFGDPTDFLDTDIGILLGVALLAPALG